MKAASSDATARAASMDPRLGRQDVEDEDDGTDDKRVEAVAREEEGTDVKAEEKAVV